MGGLERIRISPSGGCCAFVFRTGTVQGVYLRRILAIWASSELLPAPACSYIKSKSIQHRLTAAQVQVRFSKSAELM